MQTACAVLTMQTAFAVLRFAEVRPAAMAVCGAPELRAEFDFYEPGPGRLDEDDPDDDAEDFEQDDPESDDLEEEDELIRELVVPEVPPLEDE
jgi:hypothetical protein